MCSVWCARPRSELPITRLDANTCRTDHHSSVSLLLPSLRIGYSSLALMSAQAQDQNIPAAQPQSRSEKVAPAPAQPQPAAVETPRAPAPVGYSGQ